MKNNSIYSISSHLTSSLSPIIDNSNPTLYKSQWNCKVCNQTLKDTTFSKAKKYFCKFCHFAVCSSCSKLRCFHSELQQDKRICISCFNETVRSSFKEKTKAMIPSMIKSAIEQSKLNIIEVNSLEDELDRLKEVSFQKREELIRVSKEVYGFKEENQDLGEFKSDKEESDLKYLKLDKISKKSGELNWKFLENQKIIEKLQVLVERNQKKLGEVEFVKKKKTIVFDLKRCLENIRDQVYYNTGIVNTLKRDVEKLGKNQIKKHENCVCF